ncbi:MAG: hypothetical protein K2G13_05705 [Muribaculaceae bacterium]|nr:hypothetical protein [Muribaculaceae bacterium]
MSETLVPIFVCVVLPIAIVLIVSLRKRNSDNMRAEILVKAIESGREIDTKRLTDALQTPRPTQCEILYARLLRGCIYTLVGIALIIIYLIGLWSNSIDNDLMSFSLFVGPLGLAVGMAYLIVYFVTRKQVLEEKSIDK